MKSPGNVAAPCPAPHRRRLVRRLALLCALLLVGWLGASCTDDDGGDSSTSTTSDVSTSYDTSDPSTSGADTSSSWGDDTSSWSSDTSSGSWDASSGGDTSAPMGNTNVSLGGAQDFGYFRRLLDDGVVPTPADMEAAGFFAEHHTPLPEPVCGEQVCVQAMLGVMGNMVNGGNCTMVQLGLNSPLVADPDNRPPLDLVVVVDVSGSMAQDGKLDFVRQGLHRMVNELTDTDQIAIVTYSTNARIDFPMQPVAGARNTLSDLIDGLQAQGNTNLYGGLEQGYLEALAHYDSGRQSRVLLLSDGNASSGITDPVQIVDMSRAYNSDGLGLTTIGLGTSFNYELMRDLALQADGNYYFVEDASAVDEVFSEELSYFTLPVAYDVTVSLTPGGDYTLGQAHGSPFWEATDDGGGQVEVPSVFLAHRTSHDDVTPGEGRRGGGSALLVELVPRADDGLGAPEVSHVATVALEFREPGTDRIVTDRISIEFPGAPWELPVSGHFDNPIVEKSFVMLNLYVALEMAVTLFHGGRPDDAVGLLERVVAAAADYEDSANEGTGDVDIQLDIELVQQLIEVMQAQGANTPPDNEIPEDPWPAD